MSSERPFSRENLDSCLKELAKEFRRMNGTKMSAEIILIGGASILINYGFREMTYDIDAVIQASSALKEAIHKVGDRQGFSKGWLNADFMYTTSYTPKLTEHSKYYKTFSNVLKVRTVSEEYLLVMKLMAGRKYKNDLSDVVGILIEQKEREKTLSLEDVKRAATELYGSYEALPKDSKEFTEAVFQISDLRSFYRQCRNSEIENRTILLDFDKVYPEVLNQDNLDEILSTVREKKSLI